jgi:Leucine-rich repeat (LRR) protein
MIGRSIRFVGVAALLALVPLGLLLLAMKIDTPETRAAWAIEDLGGDVKFSGIFFGTVRKVDFKNTEVTDAALMELKECKNLKELSLNREQVTDGVLRTLGEMGLLHVLSCAWAEGGERPSGPTEVTSLSLSESKVTDAGLKELKNLKNIQEFDLWDTQLTDEGLKELKDLTNLKVLRVLGTKVTDKGLKELKVFKNLQELNLSNTAVTDEGLKELKGLTNLKELGVHDTKVTDKGLKELKELNNLTTLQLANTKVTDEGLKELKVFKNLELLNLSNTAVTDEGLKELRDRPNLKDLVIYGTKVTDKGLKELKTCENLEWLDLANTAVTDAGLKELKDFTNLKRLFLYKTRATNKGVRELKDALPECQIVEKDLSDSLKDMKTPLFPLQAHTRSTVSSATIYAVVKVLLAALVVIAPAIYAASKVWQRTKRP